MAVAPLIEQKPAPDDLSGIEAEQALLGILLIDVSSVERLEGLKPGHFAEQFHGLMFEEIAALHAAGRIASPTFIAGKVAHHPAFADLGGRKYFADLAANAPSTRAAPDYAREIMEHAMRRGLVAAAETIKGEAVNGQIPPAEALHNAEATLSELAHDGPQASAWASASAIVGQALDQAAQSRGRPGLTTGLAELDALTGGFRRGQLAIVAGRPAMGKSTVATHLLRACAESGKGALFFSLEMAPRDVGLRMACDLAHDPYAPWLNGRSTNPAYFIADKGDLHPDQWRELRAAQDRMAPWPLDIDARGGLTASQMFGPARRRFREWEKAGIEPGLIVVDHLTIVRPEKERAGNKVAEVGDISRALAEMAKALNAPVVALCQLSRAVEGRGQDKRPSLADLRWSGEIEQDARLVTFLYRPEYYCRRPEDENDDEGYAAWKTKLGKVRNRLWWLVEKNNNGPTGEIETYCDMACSAIRDRLDMQGRSALSVIQGGNP